MNQRTTIQRRQEKILDGLQYATDNFKNENAPHLKVDKALIRSRFNLDDKKVLDFGCGMGGMSLWYATNWNCEVHGVDIDGHHIEVARQLQTRHSIHNVIFEKRNILEQPLMGQYDFIFMNDVAEHIPLPVLKQIFSALSKSLAAAGSLFITYPPWKSPYASHLNGAIRMPWLQFLPDPLLMKIIEKYNQPIVGDLESDLKSAYRGLNHLTHNKLMAALSASGLTMTFRKSHSIINRLAGFENLNLRLPPFDFLITKEFVEMKHDKL